MPGCLLAATQPFPAWPRSSANRIWHIGESMLILIPRREGRGRASHRCFEISFGLQKGRESFAEEMEGIMKKMFLGILFVLSFASVAVAAPGNDQGNQGGSNPAYQNRQADRTAAGGSARMDRRADRRMDRRHDRRHDRRMDRRHDRRHDRRMDRRQDRRTGRRNQS
jgi:hypothetical protein